MIVLTYARGASKFCHMEKLHTRTRSLMAHCESIIARFHIIGSIDVMSPYIMGLYGIPAMSLCMEIHFSTKYCNNAWSSLSITGILKSLVQYRVILHIHTNPIIFFFSDCYCETAWLSTLTEAAILSLSFHILSMLFRWITHHMMVPQH